jgi:hypothetical protein
MLPDEDGVNSILRPHIQPWYDSIENPQKAQERVLADLLQKFGSTEYGASRNAAKVTDIADYRDKFPIINYSGLIPYLKQVKERNYKAILPEPPETWVMTSGSTGHSKVLPQPKPTSIRFTATERRIVISSLYVSTIRHRRLS